MDKVLEFLVFLVEEQSGQDTLRSTPSGISVKAEASLDCNGLFDISIPRYKEGQMLRSVLGVGQ
jgi:hypothetical protein